MSKCGSCFFVKLNIDAFNLAWIVPWTLQLYHVRDLNWHLDRIICDALSVTRGKDCNYVNDFTNFSKKDLSNFRGCSFYPTLSTLHLLHYIIQNCNYGGTLHSERYLDLLCENFMISSYRMFKFNIHLLLYFRTVCRWQANIWFSIDIGIFVISLE